MTTKTKTKKKYDRKKMIIIKLIRDRWEECSVPKKRLPSKSEEVQKVHRYHHSHPTSTKKISTKSNYLTFVAWQIATPSPEPTTTTHIFITTTTPTTSKQLLIVLTISCSKIKTDLLPK
jgi:hypothetical protein